MRAALHQLKIVPRENTLVSTRQSVKVVANVLNYAPAGS
jgi:hypothetical protein